MAAKRKRLDDRELKSYIEDKLRNALGAPDSRVAKDRERNLRAYLAEPKGEWAPPEIDDRSDVVATDVADTIEWMLPSLLRVFTASRDAIEAAPRRPEFEPQASQVQEVIRWLFWSKLDGVSLLHEWFKDALISKVGFVKVRYEKKFLSTVESYEGLTEPQVEMLASDPEIEVTGKARRDAVIDGQSVPLFDVECVRKMPDGGVAIDCVPADEMRVDVAARYNDEPQFIGQEYQRRRSTLEALGYDCEGISADATLSSEQALRQGIFRSSTGVADDDDEDPQLAVTEAYIRTGTEDGGTWEHVLFVGDEQMLREEVDEHPYAWFCPSPLPHVFHGHCPADFAIEPQRVRTLLLRAVMDNVFLTVNQRTGIVGDGANIDDVLNSRPGGIVRLKDKDALVPIIQPDMTSVAWPALEWAEQWTEKRTGFSRLSKGLSSEALNDTATGVIEITERADMRVELIARHAAVSLTKLLRKVLRCLSRHQDVAMTVRLNGGWANVDPREWSNQYQLTVNVGLGSANKDRQTAQLTQLAQMQAGMAQAGMVQPPAVIALARKLTTSMGVERPEQYFPDAPPPQAPQPPPQVQVEQIRGDVQRAIEGVRLQADMQKANNALQVQAANDARDAQRAQMQAQMDAQLRAADNATKTAVAEMQAAVDRYRADLDAQVKLQIAQMSRPQASQIDMSGLVRMEQAMQQLMQAVTAPKRVVRDPITNRVVGLEPAQPKAPQPNPAGNVQ